MNVRREEVGPAGCLVYILLLIVWGWFGELCIGWAMDMWIAEHEWETHSYPFRWLAGVVLGEFGILAIIIGTLVGSAIALPLTL